MSYVFLSDRVEKHGGPWKSSDVELLPYHPSASHIPPDYRDGWNDCFLRMEEATKAAIAAARAEERERCAKVCVVRESHWNRMGASYPAMEAGMCAHDIRELKDQS